MSLVISGILGVGVELNRYLLFFYGFLFKIVFIGVFLVVFMGV